MVGELLADVIFLAQVEELANLVRTLWSPQSGLLLVCQTWQWALSCISLNFNAL